MHEHGKPTKTHHSTNGLATTKDKPKMSHTGNLKKKVFCFSLLPLFPLQITLPQTRCSKDSKLKHIVGNPSIVPVRKNVIKNITTFNRLCFDNAIWRTYRHIWPNRKECVTKYSPEKAYNVVLCRSLHSFKSKY